MSIIPHLLVEMDMSRVSIQPVSTTFLRPELPGKGTCSFAKLGNWQALCSAARLLERVFLAARIFTALAR